MNNNLIDNNAPNTVQPDETIAEAPNEDAAANNEIHPCDTLDTKHEEMFERMKDHPQIDATNDDVALNNEIKPCDTLDTKHEEMFEKMKDHPQIESFKSYSADSNPIEPFRNENVLMKNVSTQWYESDASIINNSEGSNPLGPMSIESDLMKNAATQWYKNDGEYFSVGYFLKKDGTSEELRLHVSEAEDSEEEDIDEDNPPHHFADDGSIEKVDLRKRPPKPKKFLEPLDDRNSVSFGNFLKDDGTLEELRISFDDLGCDSDEENDGQDFLEGISSAYHVGEDGSLQMLLEEKPSKSIPHDKKIEIIEGKEFGDEDIFGDKQPFEDSDKINIPVDRKSPKDIVISANKKIK